MPRDLSKRTIEEREEDVLYLMTLPMSELRKRQKICNAEKSIIYARYMRDKLNGVEDRFGNRVMAIAMANVDEKERDLIDAISSIEIGKSRRTKRARPSLVDGSIEDMKNILAGMPRHGLPMVPPRSLKLMSGHQIMLDGRVYTERFAGDRLEDAIAAAEELSENNDVYITYASSLYHDDSSTIYVYAAPQRTKQTKLFRSMRKRPKKPQQKVGKKKRILKRGVRK